MKKYFLSFLSLVLFSGIFLDSVSAITILSHPRGTGSEIRFNEYEDAYNLLEDRGYGMSQENLSGCVDLPPFLEQDFEVTLSNGQSGTVEWENVYQNGYPFFEKNCSANQYNIMRSDAGFSVSDYESLMNEANFSVARECSSADCGGLEPVLNTDSTSAYTTGQIPYYLKPSTACVSTDNLEMQYSASTGSCYVRPKLPNYAAIPQYRDSLQNLSVGDTVRVFTYIHNNASEFIYNITSNQFNSADKDGDGQISVDKDGDGIIDAPMGYNEYRNWSNQQYLDRLATNAEVSFNWSNPSQMSIEIDSDQTTPITDTVSVSYTAPGLGLRPVIDSSNRVQIERRNSGEISEVFYISGQNLVVPMGSVASSYGNVQEVFVDFEVVLDSGSVGYSIEKVASTTTGVNLPNGTNITASDNIGPGDTYNYTVRVTNTSITDETGIVTITDPLDQNLQWVGTSDSGVTYNPSTHTVTMVFQSISAGVTIPATKTFEVRVSPSLSSGITPLVNTAIDTTTGLSSSITLLVGVPSQTGITLTKRAETPTGTLIPSGSGVDVDQIYRYVIRVENTSVNPTQGSIVLTDTLDSNLSYIDSVPTGDVRVSELNGVVTLDFGVINPGSANAVELAFEVQVNSLVPNGTVIPNVAIGPNLTTNTVNHIVGGGGGGNPPGGGSAPTVNTGGVCHQYPNGKYECRKVYPEWNLNDPDYLVYEECMKNSLQNGTPEDECLAEWVSKKEFTPCTLPEKFRAEQLGKNPEDIAYQECALEEVIPACEDEWKGDKTTLLVSKKIVSNSSVALSDTITYEVKVNVNTGTSARIFQNNMQEGLIEKAVLQVYDFVIPSASGWLSGRDLVSSSSDWEWKENHFEKVITDTNEINQLNSGGIEYVFQYTMDSGLVANQNICQIKNVAFGTIDFTLKKEYQEANLNTIKIFHQQLRSPLGGEEKKDSCQIIYLEDLHSLGSDATATLEIVRPFLQTRGGSNLGIKSKKLITGDSSEITESEASSSETFTDGDLSDEVSQSSVFQDRFFSLLKNNVSDLMTRFEVFIGTEDNTGVWFLPGNKDFEVPAPFELGRSETFILEEGDLIINNDLRMTGGSRKYIPAFIVKNGDIKIAPEVTEIEGIFIALNGSILSGNGEEISNNQLVVSGSLIGDAFDLLYNRRYIGEFRDGALVGKLEPSVKITYNLRLLENTPPALENFLGNNWQQQAH